MPNREFSPKLSPALRAALAADDRERYPIVVRILPLGSPLPTSRPDSFALAQRQAAFESHAKAVTDVLQREGGVNVRHLWIADAVSAEASAPTIEKLALLDLTREIQLDDKKRVLTTPSDRKE
jgi:hypothetical protein